MAVYKIFPYQDTTLYSMFPKMNTGIDPINQVSNLNFAIDSQPSVARSLIKFDTDDITNTIENVIGGTNFQTRLRSFIATAQGIVESSTLEIWPIAVAENASIDWNQGTGTYLDQPLTTDGACWESPFFANGNQWPIQVPDAAGRVPSGSYNTSYATIGGGAWYTGSQGTDFNVTASFGPRSDKDLNIIVDDIVQAWTGSFLPNHGFLLKWEGSAEFNPSKLVQPVMQYYSVDTNTIYPPELEFRWDDSSYALTDLTAVTSSDFIVSFTNVKEEFEDTAIYDFRIKARDTYPTRTFQTSSVYLNAKALPTSSYWGLKDIKTNEMVVDFDTSYTKISADGNGNYFKVYMDGLEPERYYQLMIKTIVGDETLIIENKDNYFKVVR